VGKKGKRDSEKRRWEVWGGGGGGKERGWGLTGGEGGRMRK